MGSKSAQIPILGAGLSGRANALSAQIRQNLYIEVRPEGDKSSHVAFGTPGLQRLGNMGDYPCRGLYWMQAQNLLYAVARNVLYEVSGAGTVTPRGTLSTLEGPVSMADNGFEMIIVDGPNGYIFRPETADLAYSRTGTTVTVTETLHTRRSGQVAHIQGDATIPDGDYTVSVPTIAAGSMVATTEYVIYEVGTSDFTLVGAPSNTVGTVFTATGTTAGTGTVVNANQWQFTTAGTGPATGTLNVINNFRNITTAYTGVNFPGATTVAFIDSYFVISVPDSKQFWLSGQYDGFYWDPLQFASKETYTDNLSAVSIDDGNLVLLGYVSLEYWQNSGGYPFPMAPISGSQTDVGLAARFSVAKVGQHLTFLARTRRGGLSVVQLINYQPVAISTPDLDYQLAKYANPADAVAFSYRQNGHEFYEISFGSEGVSWLYDMQSQAWSRLTSGNDTRHYANFGTQYYERMICGDYRNGRLYVLDPETYADDGESIHRELVSPHFFAADSLNRVIINRLRVDMEQGVGLQTGQGQTPTIMLQVSRDGGQTWGNELWVSFGQAGQYTRRAEWRRLGAARSFAFKLKISDPVPVCIISAYAVAQKADK